MDGSLDEFIILEGISEITYDNIDTLDPTFDKNLDG